MALDCFYGNCAEPVSHWLVRYLPAGYLPNPDVRAYCDNHRQSPVQAMRSLHAPVERLEFVELELARFVEDDVGDGGHDGRGGWLVEQERLADVIPFVQPAALPRELLKGQKHLAKTVKGYGMGEGAESENTTHAVKKLGTQATIRQGYVDRLEEEFAFDKRLLRFAAPEMVSAAEAKLRARVLK